MSRRNKKTRDDMESPPSGSKKQSNKKSQPGTSASQKEANADLFQQCVDNCVRYILLKAGANAPISGLDIRKNVLSAPGSPRVTKCMKQASKVLKEVYGYNVYNNDSTKTIYYYVINNMLKVDLNEEGDEDDKDAPRKLITLLVLSHIFMSNNSCSEESVHTFLKALQIDCSKKHSLFGNVNDIIRGTMIKQKLLEISSDTMGSKITYKWGSKAESSISKMEILRFVSQVYNKPQTSWTKQMQAAEDQNQLLQDDDESDTSIDSF